jgi:DNA-binding response OmpR family regulator
MAGPRKILLCDPDPATARALGPGLRRRGWEVHSARDGARALQLAILRSPDVILLDEATPLVDAPTFVRILRTNPRTERIPVVVLAAPGSGGGAASVLVKPLDEHDVVARVDAVFRGQGAPRGATVESELEGSLAQMPLPDLLQVLAMNRRTGRVELSRGATRAVLALAEGRLAGARCGAVAGEKALYRALSMREGQFAFVAGPAEVGPRLDRRADEAVLEGLRQADELARLAPVLPDGSEEVVLAGGVDALPPDLHPVTAEVARLLATPRTVAALADASSASDLEALRALAALLEGGWVVRRARPGAAAGCDAAPFLAPGELRALRARLARSRAATGALAVGKVLLAGGGPLARRAVLARLASIGGFEPTRDGDGAFGTAGRLFLGDGARVDIVALPGDRGLLPLWRPFAAGALGALVLLPADEIEAAILALARDEGMPIAVCGPAPGAAPRALLDAGAAPGFCGADAAQALRRLLGGVAPGPSRA